MKLLSTGIILALAVSATSALASNQHSNRRGFFQSAAVSAVSLLGLPQISQAKIQFADEDIMRQRGHGTSEIPVQEDLMYGVDRKLADRICNYNRHFAEQAGYFKSTNWQEKVLAAKEPITFYDSNTGKPLFVAPVGRSAEDLIAESRYHGWPSFRDEEVVWENVRVLKNSGETVSVDGTHLGHNLPDRSGNRYCINLVSIAGKPSTA